MGVGVVDAAEASPVATREVTYVICKVGRQPSCTQDATACPVQGVCWLLKQTAVDRQTCIYMHYCDIDIAHAVCAL